MTQVDIQRIFAEQRQQEAIERQHDQRISRARLADQQRREQLEYAQDGEL